MSHPEFSDFQSPDEASVDRLVRALDRAYHRPGLLLWRSFWQGVMSAMGATVGTIVVLFAIGLIIRQLGGIELLSPVIEKVQDSVAEGVATQQRQLEHQLQTITGSPTPTVP